MTVTRKKRPSHSSAAFKLLHIHELDVISQDRWGYLLKVTRTFPHLRHPTPAQIAHVKKKTTKPASPFLRHLNLPLEFLLVAYRSRMFQYRRADVEPELIRKYTQLTSRCIAVSLIYDCTVYISFADEISARN